MLTGTGSINYSTGFLIFEFNETIDATPASEIDLQKIQLIDASDTVIISDFTGASIVAQDEVTVALTITEYKRAYAQIFSGSRGGVGSALKLKLLTSAVHDVAQNNVLEADIQLVEHNDIIVPVVESVSVNYSTGVISIFMSETIKNNSDTYIDLSKLFIEGTLDQDIVVFSSTDTRKFNAYNTTTRSASIDVTISKQINIQLTEFQRVTALYNSSMSPNGDGSPILFRVHAGGIIDIGLNPVVFTSNITISESPDVVQGTIFDAEIDYNTGTLILYSTEYLDNTPSTNLDLSKIIMVDGNAGIDGVMSDLNLVGATVTSGNDLTVTVVLTEAQRVRCMKASGTRGGDGENILLSVTAGAINDLSANPVLSSSNVLIKETVDSTVPVIDDVILDLDSGILSLLFSETIDVSPASEERH